MAAVLVMMHGRVIDAKTMLMNVIKLRMFVTVH